MCPFLIKMQTLFNKIKAPVIIKTERLIIDDIKKEDKEQYFMLYTDEALNQWWGYDYREDLGKNPPTPEYFYSFMQALKEKKEEYSFAIRLDGQMIGELVLYNFDQDESAEMGFRLKREYHGHGFAFESAFALKEYVFNTLKAKTIKCKCFKQNIASKKLIEKLGFSLISEDQTHYYFLLKNNTTFAG